MKKLNIFCLLVICTLCFLNCKADLANNLSGEYCGFGAESVSYPNMVPATLDFSSNECDPSTMSYSTVRVNHLWCGETWEKDYFSHSSAFFSIHNEIACPAYNETDVPFNGHNPDVFVTTNCIDHNHQFVDSSVCFGTNPPSSCVTHNGSSYHLRYNTSVLISQGAWENACILVPNPLDPICQSASFYCKTFCFANASRYLTPSEMQSNSDHISSGQLTTYSCKMLSLRKLYPRATDANGDMPVGFINLNHKDRKVSVETTVDSRYILFLSKGSFSQFFDFNGKHFDTVLSEQVFQNSGVLSAKLSFNQIVIKEEDFDIIGYNTCDLIDCIFCSDFFISLNCMPTIYKAAMICIFVAILLALLLSFPAIAASLYILIRIIMWFYKFVRAVFSRFLFRPLKKRLDESKMELMKEMREDEASQEASQSDTSNRKRPAAVTVKRSVKSSMMPLNMAILMIVGICQACDNGLIIPVNLNQCTVVGSVKTCQMTFDSLMILSGIGSTNCITFAADSNQTHVASINVTLNHEWLRFGIQEMYSTADYEPHQESFSACFSLNGGDFCSGSNPNGCDDVNDNPLAPLSRWFSESDPVVDNFPGRSLCHRAPGCIWNPSRCPLCTDACIASRYTIRPQLGYKVFALSSFTKEAQLTFNYDHDGVDVSGQCIGATNECKFGNFSLQMIDVTSQSNPVLTDTRWIRSSVDSFFSAASAANSPVVGQIGEIQARSINDLNSGNFIFAPNLATHIPGDQTDKYTFPVSGFQSAAGIPRLPRVIDGFLYHDDNSVLKANTSDGQVKFRLYTSSPIIVTKIVSVVCPSILSLGSEKGGCYNCADGWFAFITAKSTCSSGKVMILSSDPDVQIYTSSAEIGTTSTSLTILGSTNKVSNDFYVKLCSGDKCDQVRVIFTAATGVNLRNDSQISPNTTSGFSKVSAPSDAPWFFIDSNFFIRAFTGKGTIMDYIITSLILAAGALCVLFIIQKLSPKKKMISLVKFYKNFRTKKSQ